MYLLYYSYVILCVSDEDLFEIILLKKLNISENSVQNCSSMDNLYNVALKNWWL
jgi:hypothetical protein